VQTLAEHLDSYKEKGTFDIIHQVDGGVGAYEAVAPCQRHLRRRGAGRQSTDGGDGGMCSFTLPDATDWHAALAACKSLTPNTGDEPAAYDPDGNPCAGDPCGGYDDGDDGMDDSDGDPCGD